MLLDILLHISRNEIFDAVAMLEKVSDFSGSGRGKWIVSPVVKNFGVFYPKKKGKRKMSKGEKCFSLREMLLNRVLYPVNVCRPLLELLRFE